MEVHWPPVAQSVDLKSSWSKQYLNENILVCNWDEEMQKDFKKRRSKIQFESFFIAKINDEIETGLDIVGRLLKK